MTQRRTWTMQTLAAAVIAAGAIPAAATPVPGTLASAVQTKATVQIDGSSFADIADDASGPLPILATLRQSLPMAGVDAAARGRVYLNSNTQLRHTVHSMVSNQANASPVNATGQVVAHRTVRIAPTSSRPAGTAVNARGYLNFRGVIQAARAAFDTDAAGLFGSFVVEVYKRTSRGRTRVFSGSIRLLGVPEAQAGGGEWVRAVALGDMNRPSVVRALDALSIDETFAEVVLNGMRIPYRVPTRVGDRLNVDIVFRARSFAPAGAEGLAAEVAFGEHTLLSKTYFLANPYYAYGAPPLPQPASAYAMAEIPEPATALLLAAALPALLRRKRT